MDSSAVITQITKEEARGPLRGKGTGAARRGLQPGRRGLGGGGGRDPSGAVAAAAPGARHCGAQSSQRERERGESLNSLRLGDAGRGLEPLGRS